MRHPSPVTVPVAVSRPWALWLRLTWPLARRSPIVQRPLLRLGFIHFAHWALVPRGRRRPVVLFLATYDGPLEPYVDAFAYRVGRHVSLLWGGADGFPGALPAGPFKAYVLARAEHGDHLWCAHPDGSSRMVVDALRLHEAWARFAPQARGLPAPALAAAWGRFLTEVQDDL